MTSEPAAEAAGATAPRGARRGYLVWSGIYLLLALVAGAVAAVVWVWGTQLPRYLVREDGSAVISERGLTQFFASDATYVIIGLVVGALLGGLGWKWLRGLGWGLPVAAAIDATVAALVCWGVGSAIGPGPLKDRLEKATAGDLVPIQHELHAHAALAVWPFAAMVVLLALAALMPDPEEGLPLDAPSATAPAGPATRRAGRPSSAGSPASATTPAPEPPRP